MFILWVLYRLLVEYVVSVVESDEVFGNEYWVGGLELLIGREIVVIFGVCLGCEVEYCCLLFDLMVVGLNKVMGLLMGDRIVFLYVCFDIDLGFMDLGWDGGVVFGVWFESFEDFVVC